MDEEYLQRIIFVEKLLTNKKINANQLLVLHLLCSFEQYKKETGKYFSFDEYLKSLNIGDI